VAAMVLVVLVRMPTRVAERALVEGLEARSSSGDGKLHSQKRDQEHARALFESCQTRTRHF
jgi:hypothetical protein